MRVLLVAINRMTTPFPVYPIGIDYVATALRGRHEVRTLDLACAGAEAALAQACQEFRPEVVGLSLRNICTPTPSTTWFRRAAAVVAIGLWVRETPARRPS